MLMACILDDGDEIIVPEPFYPNYNTFIRLTGASVHPITTTPEEGYKFAIRERVEACINEHTRAILFTNPGNPTGTVLTREEMKLMADIAKEHNLFVIGDEVYREFVYGGEPLMSLLQLEGYEDNVVVIDSVSKRFSACGARIGCVISRNKELMAQAMKWCQGRLCASTIDQVASASALHRGPRILRRRPRRVPRPPRRSGGRSEKDSRRRIFRAQGRLLRHGRPARGRRGQIPEVAAHGFRRPRRHRDVCPGRELLRDSPPRRQRDTHGLRHQEARS
jgi:aspartate/methionine/tyrosine aminotransferase